MVNVKGFMYKAKEAIEGFINGSIYVVGGVLSYHSDRSSVQHHVHNGGCKDDFHACHPRSNRQQQEGDVADIDAEACAKATAALHRCFAGNPEWFRDQFISRLEEGLDQDLNPSPEQVNMEDHAQFKWWTGMTRNWN